MGGADADNEAKDAARIVVPQSGSEEGGRRSGRVRTKPVCLCSQIDVCLNSHLLVHLFDAVMLFSLLFQWAINGCLDNDPSYPLELGCYLSISSCNTWLYSSSFTGYSLWDAPGWEVEYNLVVQVEYWNHERVVYDETGTLVDIAVEHKAAEGAPKAPKALDKLSYWQSWPQWV